MLSINELKELKIAEQGGVCAITGELLPADLSLVDIDRIVPRTEGGKYVLDNVRVITAKAHALRHGNKSIEEYDIVGLRTIMDEYRTWQKMRIKINNHFLAAQRLDIVSDTTEAGFSEILSRAEDHEEYFKKEGVKHLKKMNLPIIDAMRGVKGVGDITIAEVLSNVNIEKARHVSSLWAYVGYHGDSSNRHQKGVSGGGNKHLRSVMYNLGVGFLRCSNEHYEPLYRARRDYTDALESWDDKPKAQKHLDGIRYMLKHWLADLWYVWRTIEGLTTEPGYVTRLSDTHRWVLPSERGWNYE